MKYLMLLCMEAGDCWFVLLAKQLAAGELRGPSWAQMGKMKVRSRVFSHITLGCLSWPAPIYLHRCCGQSLESMWPAQGKALGFVGCSTLSPETKIIEWGDKPVRSWKVLILEPHYRLKETMNGVLSYFKLTPLWWEWWWSRLGLGMLILKHSVVYCVNEYLGLTKLWFLFLTLEGRYPTDPNWNIPCPQMKLISYLGVENS